MTTRVFHRFATAVLALLLCAPATAQAAPPTIDSAGVTWVRKLEARWTLPPGMKNYAVEAATSSDITADGPERGFFRASARVSVSSTVNSLSTHWVSNEFMPAGTYYVHVAAYDGVACPVLTADCAIEFSEVVPIVVPPSPPNITSLTASERRLRAEWTLPTGIEADYAEVATAPEVYADGLLAGRFLVDNTVAFRGLFKQTSYVSPPLPGGTYYLHVGAHDVLVCPTTTSGSRPCPAVYVSPPAAVQVPRDPPVLSAVGVSNGHLTARWSLPADMEIDFIEVATRPEVYPDGEREGEFLDEHTVFYDQLVFGRQEAYESPEPLGLGPGTYYVHVGGFVPASCLPNSDLCGVYEFADPLTFTIPGPPVAPGPTQAPAATAKAIPAFNFLIVSRKQSARRLSISAIAKQRGTITATAAVRLPGARRPVLFRQASSPVGAGELVQLRLPLSRKGLRTVRRALRRHRLRAEITVILRDDVGNARSVKRTVQLRG